MKIVKNKSHKEFGDVIYVSDDKKIFATQEECEEYEDELLQKRMDDFEKRCGVRYLPFDGELERDFMLVNLQNKTDLDDLIDFLEIVVSVQDTTWLMAKKPNKYPTAQVVAYNLTDCFFAGAARKWLKELQSSVEIIKEFLKEE